MKPPASFRDALKKMLTPSEQKIAIYGFDILGNMALIEIPDALRKKASRISRTLLDTHPYLTRVYEKVGVHSGKYRVEKTKWLAGEKNPIAVAKEWGATFRVDPGTVYYSPRLATERQRVISHLKKGQNIAVFFAGVGPYVILAAKHAQPKKVLAIEWNPKAIPLFRENVKINKVEKIVHIVKGDAKEVRPVLEYDHVILPAPDNAVEFLPAAMKWISPKGGFIHVYSFVPTEHNHAEMEKKVKTALKSDSRKWNVVSIHKVNDFSPTRRQVCALIKVGALKKPVKKRTIKKA